MHGRLGMGNSATNAQSISMTIKVLCGDGCTYGWWAETDAIKKLAKTVRARRVMAAAKAGRRSGDRRRGLLEISGVWEVA